MKRFLLAIAMLFFASAAQGATVDYTIFTKAQCYVANLGWTNCGSTPLVLTVDLASVGQTAEIGSGSAQVKSGVTFSYLSQNIFTMKPINFWDLPGVCTDACATITTAISGLLTSLAFNCFNCGTDFIGAYQHGTGGWFEVYFPSATINGIRGTFTYASVSPIPLPATLPMLLMGLAGLGYVRKRKSAVCS